MASNNDIADVIVVGAGASGAAFTWSLAQAGINVVCLEQGGWVPTDAFPVSEADAHLHWQTDFHPDPGFRGLPEDYPINEDETPIAPLMYNAVGGSLIHWGAHFPRFHPSDFRVKTLEGVADDWPVTYEELEPYYDENDRMMGVSGLKGDPAYPEKPERPCPPLSIRKSGQLLAKAFDKLGWHWWASDTAISSVRHHDQDPDVGGYLRSFATTDLTYWPPALKAGARLEVYARVREITVDEQGNATGVLYYQDGKLKEQKAKAVVLACNGVGTARLLLNSKSALFPNGLANSSGLVGKCLMHHPVGSVMGIFEEYLGNEVGGPRGSTMLSQEFYETNEDHDFIRGYDLQVLAYNDAPLSAAIGSLLGQKVAWGEGHHDEFKERFGHTIGITIMTEDLPEEHNMVTLDPELTDSDGIPAPKLNYTVSENTSKMLDHAVARATEVLEAAGAKKTVPQPLRRNAGWHLLGTARMGEDPETSVVDRWGRTHDVSNLFIIDGSIFTTSACVNPTPTIQALALRTADYMKGEGSDVIK